MHPEYQGSNVRDQDLFHHIHLHCNLLHTSQQVPFFSVGKKLSHCVSFYPALYQDNETKMFHDPAVLNTTCDLVRVMCYDMYFAPGIDKPELKHRVDCMGIGPTSNYLWTREAMLFWHHLHKTDADYHQYHHTDTCLPFHNITR